MANATDGGSAAGSPIEKFLCSLCAEELHVDHVSPEDNFIALGGDSIAAAICLNRIRAEFAVDVELGTFFAGTLRDVALTIAAAMESLETAE